MSELRDVVVIGSGPAGCTAALCTARAQPRPLLFGSSIFVGCSPTTTTDPDKLAALAALELDRAAA
ncbi:FAD-dependent oxidoreductase [Streptomyces massasporeus]|uniref:FAD-dependent oxidoreductase n=1 Tax=Streptomyces massasporeus TaxID=67324 RepID=UPI0036D0C757